MPQGGYPIMAVDEYIVATSYAARIFPGDPMVMTSSSPIHGSVTNTYTSATYDRIVGVAAEGLSASVGSTAFKVYNDLRQTFSCLANLESTGGTQNIIGSAFLMSTAGTSNATIDRSDVRLLTSAGSAGAGGALRVIGLHPIESTHVASSGSGMKHVLVQFANHVQVQSTSAVGVTST
jgi:hypothetical protein